jgi:hypothetical protein
MDEEIERLVVSVRADTAGFARDVAAMRGELEGPLATGAGRAGKLVEASLTRAIMSGKLGFDDLRKVALSALSQIAQAGLRTMLAPSGQAAGSLGGILSSALAGLTGAPGRSHGGSVSSGRSYWVGERGPELFVPSSGGRIEPVKSGGRDVRVSIAVQSPQPGDPMILRQSSRQLARAVRSALKDR